MRTIRFLFLALGLLSTPLMSLAQSRTTVSLNPGSILADALNLVGPPTESPPGKLRIRPGQTLFFIGDSITAAGGYIRLAEATLKSNYPNIALPSFVNSGIGGQQAENMAPRFARDMRIENKPSWIFINVGINDVCARLNHPHNFSILEAYKTNVTSMVVMAQTAGANVVLLSPTIAGEQSESEGNKRLAFYVDAMKQIGVETGCTVVDLHAMFLKAVTRKSPGLPLTSDGIHMALYGDAIMAVGVLRALGVPDTTIAQTDTLPFLQCRGWSMSARQLAERLEIPPSRFAKTDLLRGFTF